MTPKVVGHAGVQPITAGTQAQWDNEQSGATLATLKTADDVEGFGESADEMGQVVD